MRWATQHMVSGLYILVRHEFETCDLTLAWPVTSKFKLKRIIGSVLSRAFVCRLSRVAAVIGSRVIDCGRLKETVHLPNM